MSDVYIRNEREQQLVQYALKLAQQIDKTAGKYDESGELPFEHFKILEGAGYFKLTVPKKYGGEEISLYEMLLVQEQLAKGYASTALSVGWHLLTFLNVREAKTWPEPIFAELCHNAVKEGSLLNIINSERGVKDYAIDFAKNTYSYSLNTIAHASHVQQKMGARRTLYSIAAQVEQNPAIKNHLSEDVSIAKYVICNNAIDTVTKAMQVVGGRSLSKASKFTAIFSRRSM
ncbi:acyl-CoA dehydrogenase family protein [Lysinibacillus sphaericus]|uniref:acyl-CoA dehydrogenase family protein n=1 Tax=Lysinibacillus sphaericus TaxID=1421 RepID=UPI002104CE87|nr:acyl-CoA dehydrogenase family protein [Lysinibacillus sp. SDF0037]